MNSLFKNNCEFLDDDDDDPFSTLQLSLTSSWLSSQIKHRVFQKGLNSSRKVYQIDFKFGYHEWVIRRKIFVCSDLRRKTTSFACHFHDRQGSNIRGLILPFLYTLSLSFSLWLQSEPSQTYEISTNHQRTEKKPKPAKHMNTEPARSKKYDRPKSNDWSIPSWVARRFDRQSEDVRKLKGCAQKLLSENHELQDTAQCTSSLPGPPKSRGRTDMTEAISTNGKKTTTIIAVVGTIRATMDHDNNNKQEQ